MDQLIRQLDQLLRIPLYCFTNPYTQSLTPTSWYSVLELKKSELGNSFGVFICEVR